MCLGAVNEVGAIADGVNAHAGRQQTVIQVMNFGFEAFERGNALFVLVEEDDAFQCVGMVVATDLGRDVAASLP